MGGSSCCFRSVMLQPSIGTVRPPCCGPGDDRPASGRRRRSQHRVSTLRIGGDRLSTMHRRTGRLSTVAHLASITPASSCKRSSSRAVQGRGGVSMTPQEPLRWSATMCNGIPRSATTPRSWIAGWSLMGCRPSIADTAARTCMGEDVEPAERRNTRGLRMERTRVGRDRRATDRGRRSRMWL